MAKLGTTSKLRARGPGDRSAAAQALVGAAVDALREEGFAGASARTIASRAGCNQGLVFYHFGSVANLLLAALDHVSEQRFAGYEAVVDAASGPTELVDAAARIFRDDLDGGHVAVLVEMIAGASSTPGLGDEIAKRIAPWQDFARHAVERFVGDSAVASLMPAAEVAHVVVALYLGLEMLARLDGDRAPALALFERAAKLAPLLSSMTRTGGVNQVMDTGPESQGEEP